MKKLILIVCTVWSFSMAIAQSRTSTQNGDWDQTSTWGGQSVPDNSFGTFGTVTVNNIVTVRAATYTSSNPLQIDNLVVGTTGSLVIEPGAYMRLQNGMGTDLTISGGGTFSIQGNLLLNSGVSYSGLTAVNTGFSSGAALITTATTIPTASGYGLITVRIQDITTSTTLNASWSQLTSTTNLVVDCPSLGNRSINFGGFITALNSLQLIDTDGVTGGKVFLNSGGTGTINIGTGGISISGESRFALTNGGTVTLNMSGDLTFSPAGTAQFSHIANAGTGTINFNGGDFVMTSGLWRMVAGSTDGDGFMRFNNSTNMLVSGGTISENGSGVAQGTIEFLGGAGNQGFTAPFSSFGMGTINLVVNKAAGSVQMDGGAAVTALTLTSGTLENINAASQLSISGAFTATTGTIDANTPLSISIQGSGSLPATIPMVAGSLIEDLLINRTSASVVFSNTSIADGGSITITNGSLSTAIPPAGVYDVVYANNATITTGSELPVSTTALRNLTLQGNGGVNLATAITINGDLTLQASTASFAAGANNISVRGDLIVNRNMSMSATGTLSLLTRTPSNVHSISGSATTFSVGNLTVNGDLTLARSLTLTGTSLAVQSSSSLVATAGTVVLSGMVVATNAGTGLTFNDLTINGALTAPLNGTITINGNLAGNGAFTANGGTVAFDGNGSKSITGASRTFNHLSVGVATTLSTALSTVVAGNITVDGSLNFTAGTLTKSGSGTLSGSGSTSIGVLTISSGQTFSASSSLSISGAFNGNGNFSSSSSVTFTGTTALSGAGTKAFHDLVVNGVSLTPNSDFSVSGDILVTAGTLVAGSYTTTFTGTSTISGSGSIALNQVINNGSLTFPASTISLAGNFTNNGTFNHNNGTVAFTSSGTKKTIGGTNSIVFNNMVVADNSSPTDVTNANAGGISLAGVLTVNPLAVFDADGTGAFAFTLLSTNSIDASIAPLLGGATVSGDVGVQRYIAALDNAYRYISSPVTNSTVAQLQSSGIPVLGNFTGSSFGQPECGGQCPNNFYNLGWYDEVVPGYIPNGYKIVPAQGNDATEILAPGRGYELYMWNAASPVTWTPLGPINQGDLSFSVTHTPSNPVEPTEDGWNLIGNPYPSAITWEDNTELPGGWSVTDVDPAVWIFDEASSTWRYYDYSDNSGNLTNGLIAKGQAFWVVALNTGNASLVIHEAAKNSAAGTLYRQRTAPERSGMKVVLSQVVKGAEVSDHAFIFSSTPRMVRKLEIGREILSVSILGSNGGRLAYSTLSEEDIPLSVRMQQPGIAKIAIESMGDFADLNDYYLVDTKLGKVAPVTQGYTFAMDESDAVKSSTRFFLSRNPVKTVSTNETSPTVYPNPTSGEVSIIGLDENVVEVSVLSSIGVKISSHAVVDKSNSISLDLKGLANGVYFVKVASRDGKSHVQRILKN